MGGGSIVPRAMRDAVGAMRQSFVPYFLPYLGLGIFSSGLLKANQALLGRKSLASFGLIFCFGMVATQFFEAATSGLYLRSMNQGRRANLGQFRTALQTSGLGRVVAQLLWKSLLWMLVAAAIAFTGVLFTILCLALFHPHSYAMKGQKHPWIGKVWSITWITLCEVFWSRYWFVLPSFMQNGAKADFFQEAVQRAKSFRFEFCLLAACVALVTMTPYQFLRPWLIPFLGLRTAALSMRAVSIFVGAFTSTWLILFKTACFLRSTPHAPMEAEAEPYGGGAA